MVTAEIRPQNLRPHKTFEDGLAAGELNFQRCGACGASVFYPRVACNFCGSVDLSFEVSAGRGRVYATTAVGAGDDAYSVCLIDLDEGFRMMSTVVEMPARDVAIGMRVACRSEEVGENQWRAVFFATPDQ